MTDWLRELTGELGTSVVYDVLKYGFFVLLWPGIRWVYTKLRSLNRDWAIRYNERYLEQLLLFRQDRTALTQYLVSRVLWALLLIGGGMMFLPLGDTPGGRGVLLILGWLLGGTLYVVTLSGVAMLLT